MSAYRNFLQLIPEVADPVQKSSLKKRLGWTFGVLLLFLFLAAIPLYGVNAEQASYFQTLELLLGAKIGKLLTLGIGPIVTASIILQLLKGAGIVNFDLSTEEGKFVYSGTNKLLTFFFIIVESIAYVAFGAVKPADPSFFIIIVLQMMFGGFLVFYMDEVIKKWGIGSGISLFIAAGVGQAVFLKLFSPFTQTGTFGYLFGGSEVAVGLLWAGIYYLANQDIQNFFFAVLGPLAITVGLFFLIIFFQSVNVEIPLSLGRIRGQVIRWPLNFFYAGVIPVILISALGASLQMWARLFQSFAEGSSGVIIPFISEHILGQFQAGNPISGLVNWIYPISIWSNLNNFFTLSVWPHIVTYVLYLVVGSTIFSYFWVQTAGMDSKSQAKNILKSGLQIPGFRADGLIIERLLARYIGPLTIIGGVSIGLLAATADILSALTSGTSILLLIMTIYQFYQQLARESMEDFSLLRKLMRK